MSWDRGDSEGDRAHKTYITRHIPGLLFKELKFSCHNVCINICGKK